MYTLLLVSEIILFIWFIGCTTDYKIGKYTLVDGVGVPSPEFILLIIYGLGILSSIFYPKIGQIVVLFILLFWIIVQFFCHWYFTIFGASSRKLKGYNKCFKDTISIFPASDERLIPDFYHIVLHILILINIVLDFRYLL